ncbi:MAG: winged helix-turn-helix domain-containing protein [Rhodothermales bacterium]
MNDAFHIGRWHILPQRNRIADATTSVQVEPKVMQVLVYLSEQAGEVVRREELLSAVWPDVVVGNEVVSRAISELRKAFGDNARAPEFIETIPKAGYRLMAAVSYVPSGEHMPEPSLQVTANAAPAMHIPASPGARRWVALGLGMVLLVLAMWWFIVQSTTPAPAATPLVQTSPLTTSPGFEFAPALSPDGRHAAFIWTGGPQNGPLNVYVKLVGSQEPLQLTDSPLYEWSPAWSPDGREVAFARSLRGLFVMPALGGPERKLTDIGRSSRPALDWSPQGNLLAFTDRETAQHPYRIHLYNFATGTTTPLTTPPPSDFGDDAPAFSPDGQHIAFSRATNQAHELYVVSVRDGETRQLTTDRARIAGVTWTDDGGDLIFSSNRGGTYDLWRISATRGTPEPIATSSLSDLREPVLRGDVLTYTDSYTNLNIWQYNLMDSTAAPIPWMPSSRWDADPHVLPDAQRVVFASARSGHPEIWMADRAGTQALQLTSFQGPHTGHPRGSPDNKYIAFDTRVNDHADIYVVEATGGVPRRLTTHSANDLLPSWSPDGAWIYFTSNRGGARQIWRIAATGGDAEPVTQHGGYAAWASPDGRALYYSRRDTSGIWRTALNPAQPPEYLNALAFAEWGHWALTSRGLYTLDHPSLALQRYDVGSGQSTHVRTLQQSPSWRRVGFTVAPDDAMLLVTQTDQSYYDIVYTTYSPR